MMMDEQLEAYNEYANEELAAEVKGEDMPVSLTDFLCANPVQDETEKVVLCERLKDFEFEIGAMDKKQYDGYINQCVVKDGKGKVVKQNIALFNELVVINHCLYPDFRSTDFVQKAGAITPGQALYKVLKLGEVEKLADCILKFNGFDRDFETLRKKAKN
mgnify:CR=1 FL=1